MLRISFRYSDGQIQCKRKLDGAVEEVITVLILAAQISWTLAKKKSITRIMSYTRLS